MTPIVENFPVPVETQLLRDLTRILSRIEELIVHQRSTTEKEFVALLKLALTMETTLAVWCWRHVHLDHSPEAQHRVSLKGRAEAAVDDADRLVNMLSQLTGMPFPLDWISSTDVSVNAEERSLSRAVRDQAALTADRIALGLYERLIEHAKRHHAFAINLLDDIASRRRKRLLALVQEKRS